MKYYFLKNSSNRIEVGIRPQSQEDLIAGELEKWDLKNPMGENIKMPEPLLMVKANKTSVVNCITINPLKFIVMNNKFKRVLSQTNLDNHVFKSLRIHHGGEVLTDYSIFHMIVSSNSECINYEKSQFVVGQPGYVDNLSNNSIIVNSHEEYMTISKELWKKPDSPNILALNVDLDFSRTNYDLIRFSSLGMGYYVSERLREIMERENITGVEFEEIERKFRGRATIKF